jgi:CTP synthase
MLSPLGQHGPFLLGGCVPKYIFVTGGVVSSVGKGITTASLGRILKSRGLSVSIQKLDPYLNVDPGTMSPYQHGEVFVTADGAETDLDLGHYERFIDQDLSKASSVTTGQIYQEVIRRERRGDYLGGTIQAIPHVTNEIKRRIRDVVRLTGAEVVIIEVGGTVGDIESQPYLEAIRQMRNEEGRNDTVSIHVAFLPYISSTGELKTKPTQHSVRELRSLGIQPDVIVCRSDFPVPDDIKAKLSLFCDVEQRAVVPMETADTIYRVPLILEDSGLGDFVIERLQVPASARDLDEWRRLVARLTNPAGRVTVAVVGKYVELHDAYLSVKESLSHAGIFHNVGVDIRWIQSESLRTWDDVEASLADVQGIVVPGGFGERGIEGKVLAARFARERSVPYLGLCLGMQVMVVEFARHVFGTDDVNSTEFDTGTTCPVISLLSEQRGVDEKGGTMRLGAYPCRLQPDSRAEKAYGVEQVVERHRHRYEFNNAYRALLAHAGLTPSGVSPDGTLVEICELRDHPWMLGTQFHPEFLSRPDRPHPLFRDFIAAVAGRLDDRSGPSLAETISAT